MVYRDSSLDKAFSPNKIFHTLKDIPTFNANSYSTRFIQLVGDSGSGSRRLAFHFLSPALKTKPTPLVAWLSPAWNLYAPLLWKLARDFKFHLVGLECGDRKKWRTLWRELKEAEAFDAWILDGFQLKQAEGFFLQKLLANPSRSHSHSPAVLVLDREPHTFCRERIHIDLSHKNYRWAWSKGGSQTPQYLPSPAMQWLGDDSCLR